MNVVVVGGGSWGTAFAWLLVEHGHDVTLACRDPEQAETVLTVDVPDVKSEAERLRAAGVEVGTVVEIPGTIRLLDIFDLDGNRLQLSQDL